MIALFPLSALILLIFVCFFFQHVPNHGPADHDMITDLNTASLVKNWQSVAHAQMQASAAQIAMANNRQDVNPPMVIRNAHASDTPRFFAWSEAAEGLEVEKKVLTFDNAHSEYRDCYVKKQPLQRVRRCNVRYNYIEQ